MKKNHAKLRLVPPPSDPRDPSDPTAPIGKAGDKLRALREALGLTQDRVAARTAEEAERSKGRFTALTRVYLSNIENGRNAAETERVRGVLSAVFGITRDQLADYLDGVLSLDALVAIVRSGVQARIPVLGDHPRWEELCAEAMRFDPTILPETLARLAGSPWTVFPIADLTVVHVAGLAVVAQKVPRRTV